jgi:hypothetical protein
MSDALKAELLRSPECFIEERRMRAMPSGRPGKLGASYWAVRNDQLDLAKHLSRPGTTSSSWFPMFDRNPQTFVDIHAKASDSP